MSRWVSLAVLLAIIAVTGVVLYQVMASFLLPLFLASVLTVIFRPLHQRVRCQLKDREATAALVTTAVILLTVLVPLGTVVTFAVREAFGAVGGVMVEQVDREISELREKLGMEIPYRRLRERENMAPTGLPEIDQLVRSLPDRMASDQPFTEEDYESISAAAAPVQRLREDLAEMAMRVKNDNLDSDQAKLRPVEYRRMWRMLRRQGTDDLANASIEEVIQPLMDIQFALENALNVGTQGRDFLAPEEEPELHLDDEPTEPLTPEQLAEAAERLRVHLDAAGIKLVMDEKLKYSELRRRFGRVKATYEAFRIDLLGGPIWAWMTDLANPGAAQLDQLAASIQRYLRSWLPSVAGQATAIFGQLLLGVGVMTLAMYYFLKDGPSMVQTLMKLSPLEDRYELQLLTEFDKVSRAVVLATLLSAVAQGALAGIAYWFANFDSVFLLTALTIIFALVPFVGAAAVWLPAALWLILIDDRYQAGIALIIYGGGVVSMVDNLIKPFVLHGHSKLHPLLALLSVLGGVQALGPIGILVGPMIVSFLQALLNILHHELQSFDSEPRPVAANLPNAM